MVKGTGPGLMPGARPATIEKASQSSRPQARMKFDPFFPGTCASGKTLLGPQTCELAASGGQ